MREIKFRAFVKGIMITPCYAEIEKDGSYSAGTNHINTSDAILMQFTGLKDKNGVEIYEGDIIINWDMNYTVKYELYDNMQGFSIDADDSDLEVIGNIYENPELL